jgi:hypothetical protein
VSGRPRSSCLCEVGQLLFVCSGVTAGEEYRSWCSGSFGIERFWSPGDQTSSLQKKCYSAVCTKSSLGCSNFEASVALPAVRQVNKNVNLRTCTNTSILIAEYRTLQQLRHQSVYWLVNREELEILNNTSIEKLEARELS